MSLINQMLRDLESRSDGAQARDQIFSDLVIGDGRPRRRIWPWLLGTVVVAGTAAGAALWWALFAPVDAGGADGPPAAVVQTPAPAAPDVPQPATPKTSTVALAEPLTTPAEPVPPVSVAAAPEPVEPPVPPEAAPEPAPTNDATSGLRSRVAEIPSPTAAPIADRPVISKRLRTPTSRQRALSMYQEAIALLRDGRNADAEQRLQTALELDRDHREARITLAALLVRARRLVEAAPLLEQGLSRHPGDPEMAQLSARLQLEQDDVTGAIAVLEQAVSAAAQDPAYLSLLAQLRQRNGDHAESVRRYREALRLRPEPAWFVGLAISLEAMGQPDAAAGAYRRAVSGGAAGSLGEYARSRLHLLAGQ